MKWPFAISAQVRKVIYVYLRVLEKRSANTSTEDPRVLRRILEHPGSLTLTPGAYLKSESLLARNSDKRS